MPGAKKVNTSLAKKLGEKVTQAHKANKDKPAEAGNAKLPSGIEGGVAKLVNIKIDEYKTGDLKGQPYFMAQAVVRLPATHEGVPCRGRHTQVGPIPLCDTPSKTKKTFAEHYADMLNHLKLLGVDTAATDGDMTPEEVDEFLAASMEELLNPDNPTFTTFRTWKGGKSEIVKRQDKWYVVQGTSTRGGPYKTEDEAKKKNPWAGRDPMINEEWTGRCDAPADEGEVPMEDSTGDEAPADDETPATETAGDKAPPDDTVEAPAAADEGEDWEAVATAADADPAGKTPAGKAACKKLIDLGLALGIDKATITNADSWAAVLTMCQEAQGAAEGGEEAPADEAPDEEAPSEEPTEPTKGTVVKWCWMTKEGKPMIDPKTKKPLKPSDHEILTVNTKNQTVTLKNLTTEKPVLGKDKKGHPVPWDQLS
jgi:hypothetical protein